MSVRVLMSGGDSQDLSQSMTKVLMVWGYGYARGLMFTEASMLCERGIRIHVARKVSSIRNKRRNLVVKGMQIHNFSRKIDPSVISISMKSMSMLPLTTFFHLKSIASMIPYAWFVTKLVKTYKINLIHAHFAIPEGFAGLVAKRETHKPLIVTLHGYDILIEPSVNYGARLTRCSDIVVRKVLKEADVVIAGSTATAKEALRIGCQSEKLVLIPNSVDINRFNPNIEGSHIRDMLGINGKPVVFTLRTHKPQYGIEYLIKAARSVLKDKPDVIFVVGGNGPLRRRHEKMARDLGIAQNVIFTGFIDPKEVPYYYAACDLFVIPSVIEAFGMVTVEAMACGKPVIGTNVGGIPDVIKNGVNGYLVNPKDPRSLADKITFLIENPDLMKRMGKQGRRMAERNFDIEKRVDKIVNIYHELMSG